MSSEMLPQPPVGMTPMLEPKRIKVFAVIHIVFGSLGLFWGAISVVTTFLQEKITRATASGSEAFVELQVQMQKDMSVASWVGIAVSFVISILLLRAGLALLKKKPGCLAASNTYSFASFLGKLISIVLFVAIVNPVIARTFDGFEDSSIPAAGTEVFITTMKVSMAVAGIVTPLIMAIYPLIALIMLNRREVKEYLAQSNTPSVS